MRMEATPPRLVPSGLRERRKSATRLELIQAGRKLFSEKGLYESRIEDLTLLAGIAKGTLYTYFEDKDELIRAVAASGFAELGKSVDGAVGGEGREREVLRQVVRAHLDFFASNPDLMRVFHQVRGMLKFDRASWQPLRATVNAYLDSLADILARSPRVRDLSQPARLELARLLFGAISGVTSMMATTRSRGWRTRESPEIVESLVAMASEYSVVRRRRRPRRLASARKP